VQKLCEVTDREMRTKQNEEDSDKQRSVYLFQILVQIEGTEENIWSKRRIWQEAGEDCKMMGSIICNLHQKLLG